MENNKYSNISHLPEHKQAELQDIIAYIRESVPETQLIILYGSYATGDYVEYDQRTEFGLRTFFQSDFDLVVLTPKKKASHNSIMRRLQNATSKFYKGKHITMSTPIQFFNESIEEFNESVLEGKYFYSEIVKNGIVLFDSGNYKLEPVRELNFEQISKLSKEYFETKLEMANSFLRNAKGDLIASDYKMASFNLHQATENYLVAMVLVASLYSPKGHNLYKILDDTQRFTDMAIKVFEPKSKEDERLFIVLNNAYIQARYNKDFRVTQEDIEKLLIFLEKLRINTEGFGKEKILEHEQKLI